MRSHDLVIFHVHIIVIDSQYNSVCVHGMNYAVVIVGPLSDVMSVLILASQYCAAILSWLL